MLPRQIGLKRADLTLEHRIIHSMKTVQFVKNQGKGFPAKKHQNHPAERLTVARVDVAFEIDLTRVGPHP